MRSLFSVKTFSGFGPTRVHPPEFSPLLHQIRSKKELKLRSEVQKHCPRIPGVYGMLDSQGALIYIGKAKCLRSRLMSYFRPKSREDKAGKIIRHTRSLVWESTPNEFAALVRELELIQRYRPRYNVVGQPGRQRYCYIALGRAPAPYVYVTREPTGKEVACFGPLRGQGQARDAVRRLNDAFGLRDCSQKQSLHFSDQKDLFETERTPGCLRYEIGSCSGGCVGGCSRGGYATQVRAVKAFLDGSKVELLETIQRQMQEAAIALHYERALALRDKHQLLQWLVDRLTWLRHARQEQSFIYPITGVDEQTIWYLIHRGKVQAAIYEPFDEATSKAAQEMIHQVFKDVPNRGEMIPKNQVDTVLLVASWLRKYPTERDHLLTRKQALGLCQESLPKKCEGID